MNHNPDRVALISDAEELMVERFDCDDAGKPLFLESSGLPTAATQSVIPFRWLAPACAWEPEIGMFQCDGSFNSPDLGAVISSHKTKITDKPFKKHGGGHITLIK